LIGEQFCLSERKDERNEPTHPAHRGFSRDGAPLFTDAENILEMGFASE
jgi:hypothetical protein